jgi:hypothetical protein
MDLKWIELTESITAVILASRAIFELQQRFQEFTSELSFGHYK